MLSDQMQIRKIIETGSKDPQEIDRIQIKENKSAVSCRAGQARVEKL